MFVNWVKNQIYHILNLWSSKNIAIFFVFLAISTIFWFVHSLRKQYITTIYAPIELVNLPDGKMVNHEITGEFALTVRGDGFSLIHYNMEPDQKAIKIDMNQVSRVRIGRRGELYILTSGFKQQVASQLVEEFELMSINPDTIYIGLMNRKTKSVPVVLRSGLTFKPSYFQSGKIDIEPKTIEISGPQLIIDRITEVYTHNHVAVDVSDSLITQLDLQLIDKVKFSSNQVNVTIPVEAYTESKIKVPIYVDGHPTDYKVKVFPSEINVTCLVPLSQFQQIKSSDFVAMVHLDDLDLATQTKLKVKLDKVPDFVYSINFEPIFVEFLLERY